MLGLLIHKVEANPIARGFDRLTSLDAARSAVLSCALPVAAEKKSLDQALGCRAAETITAPSSLPHTDIAIRDGYAVAAEESLGASPYTPALRLTAPLWVSSGDALPTGTNALLPAPAVQADTLPVEVFMQVATGEGVRVKGSDLREGATIIASGERIKPLHIAMLRALGIKDVAVRRPRLMILVGNTLPLGDLIGPVCRAMATELGVQAEVLPLAMQDKQALAKALRTVDSDMIFSVGGTGFGDGDHSANVLRQAGTLLVHGLALHPGETAGCGFVPRRSGNIPVILAPGRLEAALAIWLALAKPCLRHMSAATPAQIETWPLARKITSNPGLADIVLLRRLGNRDTIFWEPLATGDLPWHVLLHADAFHIVPPESEGYAAGETLAAEIL